MQARTWVLGMQKGVPASENGPPARGRHENAVADGELHRARTHGSRMGRFPKKAKGSAPPASAPVGPDAILEAVEDALERGEKKLRDREPQKAQKLFREALSQLQAAHLSNHPHGSVLLASLTGSLLTIDSEDARLASWAADAWPRRGTTRAATAPPCLSTRALRSQRPRSQGRSRCRT